MKFATIYLQKAATLSENLFAFFDSSIFMMIRY